MAVANHIIPLTGLVCAGTSLAAKQYYFVALNSSGTVEVCASGDPGMLGVLLNKPTAGQACEIAAVGSICPVSADAALSVGNVLRCSADGQAAAGIDGSYTCGMVMEAADGANNIVRAQIWFPNSVADVSLYSTCA